MTLDATDRALIEATQDGLPLTPRPFAAVAERIGATEADVLARMRALAGRGVMRRIAAAPNHYALGVRANGMTVWDVDDAQVSALGRQVGALRFVSHSYRRPRALPDWPYNLFAMVHGRTRDEVEEKRAEIAGLLGPACRGSDVLYSTRILKKTGSGSGRRRADVSPDPRAPPTRAPDAAAPAPRPAEAGGDLEHHPAAT